MTKLVRFLCSRFLSLERRRRDGTLRSDDVDQIVQLLIDNDLAGDEHYLELNSILDR